MVREGDDVSIITYGFGVHWALETLDANKNINADLVDLRTLLPWDKETVLNSVRKTGKVIILHEDTLTGGIGGEIAATIAEDYAKLIDDLPWYDFKYSSYIIPLWNLHASKNSLDVGQHELVEAYEFENRKSPKVADQYYF